MKRARFVTDGQTYRQTDTQTTMEKQFVSQESGPLYGRHNTWQDHICIYSNLKTYLQEVC